MPDNLTPEQRRRCMSNVRNRDTDIEQRVRSALHRRGHRFRKHVRDLPGTPDTDSRTSISGRASSTFVSYAMKRK
ncbi:MAG: hypothetical protein ACOC8H_00795 [bacterium]